MRSRYNGLVYATGALLCVALPPGTLRAQEGAGMMQDEMHDEMHDGSMSKSP